MKENENIHAPSIKIWIGYQKVIYEKTCEKFRGIKVIPWTAKQHSKSQTSKVEGDKERRKRNKDVETIGA
jgi:hypothetical protein